MDAKQSEKPTPPCPKTEYEQASATLRHYSGLRYAILTVFIAVNALLVAAVFGPQGVTGPTLVITMLKLLGVLAALSFGWVEFVLDRYLTAIGDQVVKNWPGSHWGARYGKGKYLTIAATRALHIALLAFWVVALFQS